MSEHILIQMARPKSEDRRMALLHAATAVFAEHGLAAPTSLISKTANVSEGSLFTYFKTKEKLINELYRELRSDLAAAIMQDFPRKGGSKARLQHVFERYVAWGVQHPQSRRALRHVSMSHVIEPEVRAEGSALSGEADRLQQDLLAQHKHLPPVMGSQALKALSEMTMELIAQYPEQADALRASGFQMLWGALTAKS